jgi:4-hydroxy-tetrahydrodipicolinate synthase
MTPASPRWTGVFVIVTTPFDENRALDTESLAATVRFCLKAGVQGVVATANASEVAYLSDAERRTVAEIVAEEARGKATVLIGVSSSGETVSADHARHAAAIGADGLMAMPPTFQRASEAEIRRYYSTLAAATGLPIMLQNFSGPGGTPMSARFMAELARDIERIRYIKEETEFSSVVMSEVKALAGDHIDGVMGGRAGIKLLDEYRRGACGTMPACEVADVHVALWQALEAGDMARAKHLYRLMLPLLVFEGGYGPAIYKEVLYRRGVIRSPLFRQTGGRVLDALAHAELDDILTDLAPELTAT